MIKNVTIEFHCPEKVGDNLFCNKCSHTVVDFTNKTDEELKDETARSKGPVCGLFKKSQLSDQFLKYAAATFIATSLTFPSLGQEVIKEDSVLKAHEDIETEHEEDVFLGVVVEEQARTCGRLYEILCGDCEQNKLSNWT